MGSIYKYECGHKSEATGQQRERERSRVQNTYVYTRVWLTCIGLLNGEAEKKVVVSVHYNILNVILHVYDIFVALGSGLCH